MFDVANEGCVPAGFLKAKIVPHTAFRFFLFEKFYNHPILVFWNEFEKKHYFSSKDYIFIVCLTDDCGFLGSLLELGDPAKDDPQ